MEQGQDLRSLLLAIQTDVKDIKVDMKEQIKLTAQHNEILRTHENRSIALQTEQKLINSKLDPLYIILKVMGILVLGVAGTLLTAVAVKLFKLHG